MMCVLVICHTVLFEKKVRLSAGKEEPLWWMMKGCAVAPPFLQIIIRFFECKTLAKSVNSKVSCELRDPLLFLNPDPLLNPTANNYQSCTSL